MGCTIREVLELFSLKAARTSDLTLAALKRVSSLHRLPVCERAAASGSEAVVGVLLDKCFCT